eukprot:4715735-Lingulodinium_polyedra.AAC.1
MGIARAGARGRTRNKYCNAARNQSPRPCQFACRPYCWALALQHRERHGMADPEKKGTDPLQEAAE